MYVRVEHISVISTHTLTWSVTMFTTPFRFLKFYFNSHAHVERDSAAHVILLYLNYFNSHAHVERDKCFSLNAWERTNFNSHAHVERDK